MRPLSVAHPVAVDLCLQQLQGFAEAADALSELELLDPSRCRGWSRLDLVVHVRMGLEEMSATCSAPQDQAVDHDAASYWATHPDDREDDAVPHVLWLRRTAAAYTRPSAALAHLRDVVNRAERRVSLLPDEPVDFQGKILAGGDFLAIWVVELAIHQLDLDIPGDRPVGSALARRTLEAIAEADLPRGLEDARAVLLGLGRLGPAPDEPALGERFPVSL